MKRFEDGAMARIWADLKYRATLLLALFRPASVPADLQRPSSSD